MMVYEVIPDPKIIGVWRAEAVDHDSEGECYVVIFSGPDSERRAREYAGWVNREDALAALTSRERRALRMRYGGEGEGPKTLADIGKALNITRERARQILSGAADKLVRYTIVGAGADG